MKSERATTCKAFKRAYRALKKKGGQFTIEAEKDREKLCDHIQKGF